MFFPAIAGAVALFSMFFTLFFLGFFFACYVSEALCASANPWVNRVNKMSWGLNPMYWAWIFQADRRRWTLYRTITCWFFTFIGVTLIALLLVDWLSVIGYYVGVAFLSYVAFIWYRIFWKSRTRIVKLGIHGERETKWIPEEERHYPPEPY